MSWNVRRCTVLIQRAAHRLDIDLLDAETAPFSVLARADLNAIEHFLEDGPNLAVTDRIPGDDAPDPWNAWSFRCNIPTTTNGPLHGIRVAFKDNVPVRGAPLEFGSDVMRGYVSPASAPVVERVLGAGATFVGKLRMDPFSCGGWGLGGVGDGVPVINPRDPTRVTGGSSSGAGAAVASGQCDLAFGGDQGGSIRIPAAWCGVLGLKPTRGAIDDAGVLGSDPMLDCIGPMAPDVALLRTAFDVASGHESPPPRPDDLVGLRVGVLVEGRPTNTEREVVEGYEAALRALTRRGAHLVNVSVPVHHDARVPYRIVTMEGSRLHYDAGFHTLARRNFSSSRLAAELTSRVRSKKAQLPTLLRYRYLFVDVVREVFGHAVFDTARSASAIYAAAYDEVLDDLDVIVMPTVPFRPPERATKRSAAHSARSTLGISRSNVDATFNTAQFNYTGHPAISIPIHGHPTVGLQAVARRSGDATLFRVANGLMGGANPLSDVSARTR